MEKAKRFLPIAIAVAFLLVGLASFKALSKCYIFQITDSLPKGIYRIKMDEKITKGSLIVFEIPDSVLGIVKERGWVPKRLTYKLMKPVAAVAGDRVKVSKSMVFINGIYHGRVMTEDSQGFALPGFSGDFVLVKDEVFAVGECENSFDSRYFGPVKIDAIVGIADPVFTF